MNTAALPLYPAHLIRSAKLALALSGALWASLLIGAYSLDVPPGPSALNAMVLLACVVQTFAVAFQGQALGRGASVLYVQRTPAALWNAWLRQWLLSVTRYWGALCTGISLLLAMPSSHLPWLVAPALLSLLLCQVCLAALARAGLLPRRLGTTIELEMIALIIYAGARLEFPQVLAWFAALPAAVLVLCALAWPAMAYWLMARKASAVHGVLGPQTHVLRNLADACTGWIARYQPLREWSAANAAPGMQRYAMLALAIGQNLIFFVQLFPVHWGEHADASRLTRLAMVCILCCNALLVRDLHWRRLLQPGGARLRRLGIRIVLSTMMFQAPAALLVAVVVALLAEPLHLDWRIIPMFAVPLLELACCTSLMTALRALPPRVQIANAAVLVALMAYAYLPQWFKLDVPTIVWQIGPAYVLVLACFTGAALWMANRLWTPRRLLNAIKIG